MNTFIRDILPRLLAVMALTQLNSSANAEEKINWRTDCVGRMQITIPGDADIAYTPSKLMYEDDSTQIYKFPDGSRAGWSWFSLGGPIRISSALTPAEVNQFRQEAKKMEKMAQAYVLETIPKGDFERIYLDDKSQFAMRVNSYFIFALVLNNHGVTLQSSTEKEQVTQQSQQLKVIVANMAYRENFSIPNLPGVCMPSLFVKGAEDEGILAATTYRLKAHPDITILLEESTAGKPGEYERPEVFTAIYKSNYFWTQRYQDYDSIENLLKFRRHNKIPFAGQRGVESMVRMIRPDKITEDFGYLVVTQGDPDAKVDTPDLMLYVIRDAQQAIKRGIKPVPKKEFFKLARQIADSVKHRGALGGEK
ncbi:hypothetical protein [Herbaspirillum rubrisubalbicans]|uniref:hypothetical protein n=1 Tax=Herbaspirillum rubrisubalbicans TaxID=80842 RepID=UPI0015C54D67|nr:hypothetical protein [Herbaspirillum rubrisubalbicans]